MKKIIQAKINAKRKVEVKVSSSNYFISIDDSLFSYSKQKIEKQNKKEDEVYAVPSKLTF